MDDAITDGGLHGKDLSKSDFSINIYSFMKSKSTKRSFNLCCMIRDEIIDGKSYEVIVNIAKNYIKSKKGFEKLAEWGLVR